MVLTIRNHDESLRTRSVDFVAVARVCLRYLTEMASAPANGKPASAFLFPRVVTLEEVTVRPAKNPVPKTILPIKDFAAL